MMLVELAEIARAAGLQVAEVDGWRTRGHGQMAAPRTVTVHHTAGPSAGDAPSLRTVVDGRPDLEGPLAQLLVARSGVVHVVAAGLCWHTGATREPWQANTYSIGVEAEHTGQEADPWPPLQLEAMRRLCRALCARYDIPYPRVLGHREICSPPGRKVDPVLDMGAFRAALTVGEEPVQECKAEPVAGVWQASVRNTFGEVVSALQVLNGIERRVADLQTEVKGLRAELAEARGEKL